MRFFVFNHFDDKPLKLDADMVFFSTDKTNVRSIHYNRLKGQIEVMVDGPIKVRQDGGEATFEEEELENGTANGTNGGPSQDG